MRRAGGRGRPAIDFDSTSALLLKYCCCSCAAGGRVRTHLRGPEKYVKKYKNRLWFQGAFALVSPPLCPGWVTLARGRRGPRVCLSADRGASRHFSVLPPPGSRSGGRVSAHSVDGHPRPSAERFLVALHVASFLSLSLLLQLCAFHRLVPGFHSCTSADDTTHVEVCRDLFEG